MSFRFCFAIFLTSLITTTTCAFNAASKNNIATYWGQGAYQQRLLETCKNPSIDIINIGFIDVFPDQGPGGWPGSNFGNACWGDVYEHNGVNTTLLQTCPDIGPDITECQQTYGKKVFLSIGGGNPNDYYIKNDTTGENFANFLWAAFGPASASGIPRPFGSAVVDGFDLDIESEISPAPASDPGYQTSGYVAMVKQFRGILFPQDTSKTYYISGSPQCAVPDSHFTTVISQCAFDFLFIQFYDNPTCSARAAIQKANGKGTNDISYAAWIASTSKNANVRMSIGLPASTTATNNASFYLTPTEAQTLIKRFYGDALFGGVMIWEATYNQNHTICGDDYATWIDKILSEAEAGGTAAINTACPTTTSTTAKSTSTSKTSTISATAKTTSTVKTSSTAKTSSAAKTTTTAKTTGTTTASTLKTSTVKSTLTSSAVSKPTPTLSISPNGLCAGNTSYTCAGSAFGNCCSAYGYCGSTSDYCGTGCDSSYGTCSSTSSSRRRWFSWLNERSLPVVLEG